MENSTTKTEGQKYFFALVLVTLVACGSGSKDSQILIGPGKLNIEYPQIITDYLQQNTNIEATLTIDGRSHPLDVDRSNKYLSGNIPHVKNGKQTLIVDFYLANNAMEYRVASRAINVEISDLGIVAVDAGQLVFSDDDHDGITNLGELQRGTDPTDASSFPQLFGQRLSENYRIEVNPIDKTPAAGAIQSANYKIQP